MTTCETGRLPILVFFLLQKRHKNKKPQVPQDYWFIQDWLSYTRIATELQNIGDLSKQVFFFFNAVF